MGDWIQGSHCHWDRGDARIVKDFCMRAGGIRYVLFDGVYVSRHLTLEAAQQFYEQSRRGACDGE